MGASEKVDATFHPNTVQPSTLEKGWGWLKSLADEVYDNAYTHGWYDEQRSFGDRIALCHSELSEALEEFRDGHHLSLVRIENGKPEGVPIELADVIIRILDMAAAENIDIAEAIKLKMFYNQTRPYRHGGKAL